MVCCIGLGLRVAAGLGLGRVRIGKHMMWGRVGSGTGGRLVCGVGDVGAGNGALSLCAAGIGYRRA
jgi:hypothetical protein